MTTDHLNNTATTEQAIIDIVARQHDYFKTGVTKSYQSRIANLNKLKTALIKYETQIHAALKQDLGKPEFESYLSETGFCLHDISTTLRKLKSWMKPKSWRLKKPCTMPKSIPSLIYWDDNITVKMPVVVNI